MTRQIVYKATFFFLPVLFAAVAVAQSGIIVKAVVDRNKIFIGEPIVLTLKADIPENEAISFFSMDSLAHFEFLEQQKIDTANTSSGTVLTQVIRITSFDSGHWVIPSFLLAGNIATDSLPVDVVFSEFDPNQDYHDIKDIIDVKVEKKKQWWWYPVGAVVLILLLVLIYFLSKKKKQVVKPAEPLIDPYAEAMKQIEKLQKDKPAPKQYYSAMVDIFRQYVLRKKGIRSLQETTDDLVLQLKNLDMSKDNFNRLVQALRLSDFVKFAKYNPAAEDDIVLVSGIKQSIQEIEQLN
jgi:hypothetical protein